MKKIYIFFLILICNIVFERATTSKREVVELSLVGGRGVEFKTLSELPFEECTSSLNNV